MSQHDYAIADADGATFLGDLNDLAEAVASNNSAATEPGTTYAYQFWADTTSGWIKQRNTANSAWIKRWPLGTAAWVDVASAATLDLDAAAASSDKLRITGTTATTAITLADGQVRVLRAAGAWPITHGASLLCPGSASYTCAAGDVVTAIGEAAGVVRLLITKADGTPVVAPSVNYTVATKTDTYSESVAADAETANITGLTPSITPSTSAKKVRVQAVIVVGTDYDASVFATLYRSGTAIGRGDAASSRTRCTAMTEINNSANLAQIIIDYLDSPATASAVTYSVRLSHGAGTITHYVNRSGTDTDNTSYGRGISTMTLTEMP